jgi:hypothetical protein
LEYSDCSGSTGTRILVLRVRTLDGSCRER